MIVGEQDAVERDEGSSFRTMSLSSEMPDLPDSVRTSLSNFLVHFLTVVQSVWTDPERHIRQNFFSTYNYGLSERIPISLPGTHSSIA